MTQPGALAFLLESIRQIRYGTVFPTGLEGLNQVTPASQAVHPSAWQARTWIYEYNQQID